jgi:PPK2 family polyphosphate:nucleotide phosphotransferase
MKQMTLKHDDFLVKPGRTIDLARDFSPNYKPDGLDKERASGQLAQYVEELSGLQNVLYAQNMHGVLIIFQAMDAAGKDSTIKYVMSGVNPQGCQVFSFKAPSGEDLDHDYLWRSVKCLPERGRIGIFNRSYYEEVLIARVHPEILMAQKLPPQAKPKQIWQQRFRQINQFEQYLSENGVLVLKFFLNVSKAEQKKRFLARLEEPEKHWKFSAQDVLERQHWDAYQAAYQDMFNHTSTESAPWYVIPADRKWFMRLAVSDIICARLRSLDLAYPKLSDQQIAELAQAKQRLLDDPD